MNKKINDLIKKNKYRSNFYKNYKPNNRTSLSFFHEKRKVEKIDQKVHKFFSLHVWFNRVMIASILLLVGLIIKADSQFKQVDYYLNSHMNISKIDHFITTNFGSIFPIPKNDDLYVNLPTIDVSNTMEYGEGIKVTTDLYEGVQSQTTGIVIEIVEKEHLGRVVVIQATNGLIYEYGLLEDIKVSLYSRIEYGDVIGMSRINVDNTAGYYLAIRDETDYIDVFDVIDS